MIHKLNPKTKDSIKAIDAAITQQTNAIKAAHEAYQKTIAALNSQKSMIITTVIEERGIDIASKLKLNENYDIEVISQEEYDKLVENPNNLPLDVPDPETNNKTKKKK